MELVHRQIKSNISEKIVKENRFEKIWTKQKSAYLDSWKPCYEYLMDTIYIEAGGIKTLSKSQKEAIKDRFKVFMKFSKKTCL